MSGSNIDVVCAGILVADMFVPPLERLPQEGELVLVDQFLMSTGGCAANAGISLAKLGVKVSIAGKVGNDSFGRFIAEDLKMHGLADVSQIRVSQTHDTSRTVILTVKGQDRRFIHAIGANADFSVGDIDVDLVCKSKILYVGGYQIMPSVTPEALGQLFKTVQATGVITVLDVAGVDPKKGLEPFIPVLKYTDAFLPNDDEARLITGEEDPIRQTKIFQDLGAKISVVTMGEKGIIARAGDKVYRAPVFPVEVVDPSGGGDAFDAGFIVGMLEGWKIGKIIEFASAVGASCVTKLGTTAGVFTRPEADAFLTEYSLSIEELQG